MPEDNEDISPEELEELYDRLDAEGIATEEELLAEIERLNKEAGENGGARPGMTRAPRKRTVRHRN